MKETDIETISKIMERKIINANIAMYEHLAYQNLPYMDCCLTSEQIEHLSKEIQNAILNQQDLNFLGCKNMVDYTLFDLNDYYKEIVKARKLPVDSWIEMLAFANVDDHLYRFVKSFLDTHTYDENIQMKRAFLSKIGYYGTEEMTEEEVDYYFCEKYMNPDTFQMDGKIK